MHILSLTRVPEGTRIYVTASGVGLIKSVPYTEKGKTTQVSEIVFNWGGSTRVLQSPEQIVEMLLNARGGMCYPPPPTMLMTEDKCPR